MTIGYMLVGMFGLALLNVPIAVALLTGWTLIFARNLAEGDDVAQNVWLLVLGVIVLSIMMQVGTFDTYAEVAPVAVEAATAERYFLIEPARVSTDGFQISAVQAFALIAGLGAIAIVLAARLVDAESGARRMGPFLYLFVAVMLIALFVAIIVQPDSSLFGVPK